MLDSQVADRPVQSEKDPWAVTFVLFLYAASLILPVDSEGGRRALGYQVLVDCLSEQMYPMVLVPVTFPNFLLLLGVGALLCRMWWSAMVFTHLALIGALLIPVAIHSEHPDKPLHLAEGYFAWVASMGLASVASWMRWR